jgi:serine/threonine-protein kinase RsbW
MSSVTIPAHFDQFYKIRDLVDQTAGSAGFDDHEIYMVQLAVDEACSNIVEHGYGGESEAEIECSCRNVDGGVEIVLRDWGIGFDPNGVPDVVLHGSIQDVKPRGAGLYLIRKFSPQDGNTMTIFKRKS